MKQTAVRRDRNVNLKKNIKNAMKAFVSSPSASTLSQVQSELDTAVKKNLLKKNTVSRRKSGLVRAAKAAGVTLSATAPKKAAATKKPAAAKKATPAKAATKPAAKKAPAKKKAE